ncbi:MULTISPECIES: hypothetical protein [unclassified Mesorhizobium]|uniref:hypothetical protein n=1 Tax=unclassified Mesorhizobium TaxID=325217 RepID=UPI00112C5C30|nr:MULTISPECIES: hypothetical protein [unclassified Mesorhizobium]TPK59068.1 hypothetical protein FJ551_26010 [Mesorhizobium sp. B2-5-1]TPL06651.1 hypothetical protein FJ944_22735 [Mesorhizobium sp. B2-4-11]
MVEISDEMVEAAEAVIWNCLDLNGHTMAGVRNSVRQALEAALCLEERKAEPVACGGCGNADPTKRCIGCLHQFEPALSSLGNEQGKAPDGWKLVPVDPTEAMLAAGNTILNFTKLSPEVWAAMLAAAPQTGEESR